MGALVWLVLAANQTNCGFPDYAYGLAAPAVSGASGSGAASGVSSLGGDAGSGVGASAGTSSGGSVDAGAGGMERAGEGGAPGCTYPAPVTYPSHCFDNAMSADETGVDCGGATCLPCQTSPSLTLQYMSIVADASTTAPKFRLLLNYVGVASTQLSDIRIRYYFNHNGVTEPVIARDTQATFDPGSAPMDIASKVSWSVHRFPLGPLDQNSRKTDSYLEIAFNSPASLSAGAKVDLTQDIVAGSADTPFDQSSHYSFLNVGSPSPNNAITVYIAGERVLGVEPPMNVLPDCAFAAGVNLGGPAVKLGALSLGGSTDASITFGGSSYSDAAPRPFPATDAATTTLLSSAFTLTDTDIATWTVPSGRYWAYAWLTSAASADAGTLFIQDNPADKFFGLQQASGAGWSQLGPYPIEVSDGTLALSSMGEVNVAALALYRAQP